MLSCTPLHAVLARVWCALMLSQSLVVFCSDAHLLSDVMLSLRSLVAPLQPLHDFRPFFTVYDRDYAAIAAAAAAHTLPTPLLAGTNDPFVAETLGAAMDVLVVPARILETVCETKTPQGVLASVRIPAPLRPYMGGKDHLEKK